MRFPEKALEEYLWIFREAPDYGGAYYHGVRLLARLDRLDEARTLLETGLAVNRRQNDRHNVAELQALSDELFG